MPTIIKEESCVDIEEILSSPYMLILWNDSYNSFDWVIECLIKEDVKPVILVFEKFKKPSKNNIYNSLSRFCIRWF